MNDESIRQASVNMMAAAESMRQTFNWWQEQQDAQRLFLTDWLQQFESILKNHEIANSRILSKTGPSPAAEITPPRFPERSGFHQEEL